MNKRAFSAIALALVGAMCHATEIWIGSFFENRIHRFDLEAGVDLGSVGGGAVGGPLGMERLPNGEVLATSESTNTIRRYAANGSYLGDFTSTGLNAPTAVARDSAGNIYAANFNGDSVTKYAADGSYLGQFVPAGTAGLNGPDLGMAFGPDGNLYVPTYFDSRVIKFNGTTGAYMGDFIASGANGLLEPRQLLWRGGYLFVASDSGNKVMRFDANTGAFIDNFVSAGSGGLLGAVGMAFVGDSLYVASSRNGKVLKYDATTGVFQGTALSGLGSPVSLQVVPEPATMAMLGGGLWALMRRRTK